MDKAKEQKNISQEIRESRLIDDAFMTVFFDGNIVATELVLKIVLGIPDLKVTNVKTQRKLKNLRGKDITLDINAVDGIGNKYDIEIQRDDRGADAKRARYHSSMLDAHSLKRGQTFSELTESYVIFITEHDVIGKGRPIYKIERKYDEDNEHFNDGGHIIYVNGSNRDSSTELGRLMHDFFCKNPDDMNYQILAERARHYKEDEKGVKVMGSQIERIRKAAAEEAIEETKIKTAMSLIRLGKLSSAEIANAIGLSIEKVEELAQEEAS